MKGNFENLNRMVPGTIVETSGGCVGVIRFLMGIPTHNSQGNICQARLCICHLSSESYVTYRCDGISNQSDIYDIEKILFDGDGVEINGADDAKDRVIEWHKASNLTSVYR